MRRAAAFSLALVMLLTGCSGLRQKMRDEADLVLVRAVGVDGEAGESLTVTADTGLGEKGEPPRTFTASAATFGEAVEALRMTPECRDAFFTHTEHLLVGEAAAETDLQGLLDFVIRSPELRLDTDLFIMKDAGAGETMRAVGAGRSSAADELSFLKRYAARTGRGYTVECGEAAADMLRESAALVPAVTVRRSDDLTEEESAVDLAGMAVLREGKLAFFLTEEESRGAVLLKNRCEGAMLTVPDERGCAVTLRLLKAKTTTEPSYENGTLTGLRLRVRLTAGVVQTGGYLSPEEREVRAYIAEKAAAAEKEKIDAALRRAQETGIDFLGLGAAIERRDPVKFAGMKERWDELFPTLPVAAEVTCTVERTYELNTPLIYPSP